MSTALTLLTLVTNDVVTSPGDKRTTTPEVDHSSSTNVLPEIRKEHYPAILAMMEHNKSVKNYTTTRIPVDYWYPLSGVLIRVLLLVYPRNPTGIPGIGTKCVWLV